MCRRTLSIKNRKDYVTEKGLDFFTILSELFYHHNTAIILSIVHALSHFLAISEFTILTS